MRKISIMGYGIGAGIVAALLTAGIAVADVQGGNQAAAQDAAIAITDPGLWLQYNAPEMLQSSPASPGCCQPEKFTSLHGAGGSASSSHTAIWTVTALPSAADQTVNVPMSPMPEATDGTPAPADFRTAPMTVLDWVIFALVAVLVVGFIAGVENLAPLNKRGKPLDLSGGYSFGTIGCPIINDGSALDAPGDYSIGTGYPGPGGCAERGHRNERRIAPPTALRAINRPAGTP